MARTTGSDDLYSLIHSLTTEEKGYFKKFSKRHASKGSTTLQLFDAINKQEVFEEKTLKKKFRNYVVAKNHLFNMILDSLVISDKSPGLQRELLKQLQYILLLQKKGLLNKAIQLNQNALLKAEEAEMFWVQEEFRRNAFSLARNTWGAKERFQKIKELFAETRNIRQKQDDRDKFSELYQDLISFEFQGIWFAEKKLPSLDKYEEILNKEKPLSVTATRYLLLAKECCAIIKANYEEQYQISRSIFEAEKILWKRKSPLSEYFKYIKALRSLILGALYTKRVEIADKINEEMIKVKSDSHLENVENELCYFLHKQYIFFDSGKFVEGESFTKKYFPHELVKKYGNRFHQFPLEFYKNKVMFEFLNRNYNAVFRTIADLELLDIKKKASFYYKCCELLKILLQVDMGNFELLQTMITSSTKHLVAYGLTPFEKKILLHLRKINTLNAKQSIQALVDILEKSEEQILLWNNFNLKTWAVNYLSSR
jgi:hypothetical protein